MLCRCFLLSVFLWSVLFGPSIDPGKVATVHVYRQGRLLVGVPIFVDGNKVASLYPKHIETFYLAPGYHELTVGTGEINPMASFKAEAGGENFFHLDYEYAVTATSLRDLKVSLSMEPKIADAAGLRVTTIDPDKLMEILTKSNPSGSEPKGSGGTGESAKPEE